MGQAHTPGPWSIRHSGDGSGDVGITANGIRNVIAECFAAMRSSGENARDEALANARLIAAAPTLFEACASVWLMLADTNDNELRLIADECRAALSAARATGGTE